MKIEPINETAARMLMMPPEGMNTSSTTSTQPTVINRIAQAISGSASMLIRSERGTNPGTNPCGEY